MLNTAKGGKKGRKYGRNKKDRANTPISRYIRGKISFERYWSTVKR